MESTAPVNTKIKVIKVACPCPICTDILGQTVIVDEDENIINPDTEKKYPVVKAPTITLWKKESKRTRLIQKNNHV